MNGHRERQSNEGSVPWPPDPINDEVLLACYRVMRTIRRFEERAIELFRAAELPGFLHPSVGQEAVATGYTHYLRPSDLITSTHRGHGHIIGKGASISGMYAELYGKESGLCRGRGGSMHIIDTAVGVLGANGIVGGGLPIATGAALGLQQTGRDDVVVSFFGEGAVNIGAFHEALNLAAIWSLPVIFVCENNYYAESTPISEVLPIEDLRPRAASYGIPSMVVDGNDIYECLTSASVSIKRARSGGGPSLIQANTYRWHGHHMGDMSPYRTKEEIAQWKALDPLRRLEDLLMNRDQSMSDVIADLQLKVEKEIDEAIESARAAPDPDPEEVLRYVYKD